jgi:hypothetical protein
VYQATVFYLQSVGEGNLNEVRLDRAITPDGRVAEISLSSRWQAPLLSDFFGAQLRISVTVQSQVFII